MIVKNITLDQMVAVMAPINDNLNVPDNFDTAVFAKAFRRKYGYNVLSDMEDITVENLLLDVEFACISNMYFLNSVLEVDLTDFDATMLTNMKHENKIKDVLEIIDKFNEEKIGSGANSGTGNSNSTGTSTGTTNGTGTSTENKNTYDNATMKPVTSTSDTNTGSASGSNTEATETSNSGTYNSNDKTDNQRDRKDTTNTEDEGVNYGWSNIDYEKALKAIYKTKSERWYLLLFEYISNEICTPYLDLSDEDTETIE